MRLLLQANLLEDCWILCSSSVPGFHFHLPIYVDGLDDYRCRVDNEFRLWWVHRPSVTQLVYGRCESQLKYIAIE